MIMNNSKTQMNLVGMKLGRLTVIEKDTKKITLEKGTHWICKCDCGKTYSVSRNNLKPFAENDAKATRSCGCSKKNRMDRERVLWKKAYCNKITNSKTYKNLNSNLSEKDFKEIALKNCHYCGLPFSSVYRDIRWKKGKEIKMTDSEIRLNGIDRINSDIGYIKENCVSCCTNCNQAKNTLSQQQFSEHIIRIYNHFCK